MGTPQSNYAALAIVCAIIAICLSIIFNNSALDFGERLSMIAFVVLFSIPSILLSLFELTCISNDNVNYPYCGWYGWIITALIVLYSVIVIVSSLMSMMTYNNATAKAEADDEHKKVPAESANEIARNMMGSPAKAPVAAAVKPQAPVMQESAPDGFMMNDVFQGYAAAYGDQEQPPMKAPTMGAVEGFQDGPNPMLDVMGSMMEKMPFKKNSKNAEDAPSVEGFMGGEYATI